MVWKIMNLAIFVTSSAFWGNQIIGASDRLSTLAHIEAMDAASTQCLGAVGTYNASRTTNLPANTACASVPLYGGIKAITREVGWHDFDLNRLFAAFLMRFPHPTFSIFASAPLAQTKLAVVGCQKSRNREVGWQKEALGALCTGMKSTRKKHREVGWHEIERLAGTIERSVGRKREGHWHRSREVCWQS
jgi:hypothetical protein